jgi:hypothetical protein
MHAHRPDRRSHDRLAIAILLFAMAVAAALLVWETRGLTLLVDEWKWGFAERTSLDLHTFVDPYNGHLVAVVVLITKSALQLFHANAAVALRLFAIAVHLAVAGCLFALLRRAIGTVGAVAPTVLLLFLGAANDVIIGSHGLSTTITALTGLGAWLALQRNRPAWDAVAAVLLTIGVATVSMALAFVVGAAALIWLDSESPRSRYWVPLVPIVVYALWWLFWGHAEKSDVAIANVAAFPAFAFDALAAGLASITGLFTVPGVRDPSFDVAAGQALAGGLLMVTLALALDRRYRPGAASVVPLATLLTFWLMTAGVASGVRAPWSSRYLYIDVILLLLVFAQEIAVSRVRSRAVVALSAICLFALPPNIREIAYFSDWWREQAEANRAVMGAADAVAGRAQPSALLEDPSDLAPGQVEDLLMPLERYAASRQRFDAPAYSVGEIESAGPLARAAADRFLVRALPVALAPAVGPPRALPAAVAPSQSGGTLKRSRGCLRFVPLTAGAQVSLRVPEGGLWARPAAGAPVQIGIGRFDESFGVAAGPAIGGRPSVLSLPPGPLSSGWKARFRADQPLLLCAAPRPR